MSLEFPIDIFWKLCQSAYLSQRLKIISDFHFQEIKSTANNDMGGRSILFFLGMGKGKEKVKEIWNVPIITYHININAIKQSIF